MVVKESKYTYKVDTEDGDLLLYNSIIGSKSFLKIKNCSTEKFNKKILPQILNNEKSKIKTKLEEKGFLIQEYEDQLAKLKNLYINSVATKNLTLVILPTENCNFRCKYCYESFKNNNMDKKVQNLILKHVKTNIAKYTSLTVMWFGGEPTLALNTVKDLSEKLMNICKINRKIYNAQMTTNGYFLDSKMIEELMKYKIYTYQITLDGLKDNHNNQRPSIDGKGTYDKIINNLLDIKQNCKNRFLDIIIRTNITKKIYKNIEDYINFIYHHFGEDSRFRVALHQAGNWLEKTDEIFEKNLYKNNILNQVYQKLLSDKIKLPYINYSELEPAGVLCYAAHQGTLVITPKGDLHRCTLLFEKEKCKVGKICQSKGINIDEAKLSKWIGDNHFCKEIEKCTYAPCCLGDHCPANRLGFIGSGNEKDIELFKCPTTKYNVELLLQVLNKKNMFEEITY